MGPLPSEEGFGSGGLGDRRGYGVVVWWVRFGLGDRSYDLVLRIIIGCHTALTYSPDIHPQHVIVCVCVCGIRKCMFVYDIKAMSMCVCVCFFVCVCVLGTHDRGESGERGSHGEQECAGHKCNCLMSMKPCVLSSPLPTQSPAASVCQVLLSSPSALLSFQASSSIHPHAHAHTRTQAHTTQAHAHAHARTHHDFSLKSGVTGLCFIPLSLLLLVCLTDRGLRLTSANFC